MSDLNEELIERIAAIWDSYKFPIVVGVLMIISAIAGLSYQAVNSEQARRQAGGALFEAMHAVQEGDLDAARAALAKIDKDDFPELRNLGLVALAAESEDAADILAEAAESESDSGLRLLFVLRQAEALINKEQYDDAIALLTEKHPASPAHMRMLFLETTGDAHFAAGRVLAARAEYDKARQEALESYPSHLPALNLKIGAALSLPASESELQAVEAAQESLQESQESSVGSDADAANDDSPANPVLDLPAHNSSQ